MRAVVPMKFPRLILCFGIFGSGFATSWLVKPTAGGADSPAPVPSREHASNSTRPVKDAAKPRFAEQLKALVEARYNEAKTKEALDQVKTEDFPRLIDELVRKAGFTGLDYRARSSVDDLIAEWYHRDPDMALAWVLAQENTVDRENLLRGLIGKVMKIDFKQGLALLLQTGKKEDGRWNVSMEFFEGLGRLNEEEMLRALGAMTCAKDAWLGGEVKFSGDFDFRRVLDGLTEIRKGLRGGEEVAAVPSNLLEDWAKRDPTAAWEWLQQHERLPYARPESFFKGYRSVTSTGDCAAFLAEVVGNNDSPSLEERFRSAWSVLSQEPNTEMLSAFLQKSPSGRLESLTGLFYASMNGSGGSYDRFKETLLRQMTAEERVHAIEHFRKYSSFGDVELFPPLLRQLGHSDEEIQRMLSPAAGH